MEGAWGEQDEGDNPYASKDNDDQEEEEEEEEEEEDVPPGEDGTTNEDDDGKNINSKEQDVDDRDTNDGMTDGITDSSGDEQNSGSGEKGDDVDTTGLDDAVPVRLPSLPMVSESLFSRGIGGGIGASGVVKTKEETEMESEDPNTDDHNDDKDKNNNNDDDENNTKDKASWDDGHSTGNAKSDDDKYSVDHQHEDDRSDYDEETEDTRFISNKGTYFAPNLPQMDPTYRLPNGDIDLELHSEEISPPVLLGVLSILAIAICMLRKPRKFAKGKKPNKIHYPMSGVKREVPVY